MRSSLSGWLCDVIEANVVAWPVNVRCGDLLRSIDEWTLECDLGGTVALCSSGSTALVVGLVLQPNKDCVLHKPLQSQLWHVSATT
jgi:hypothetical protein